MKKLRSDCLIMTDKNGHKKSVRKMVIPLELASMISVPMCTCSIPMCCLKSKLVEMCSAPLSSLTTNKRTIFRARRTASLNAHTYGPIDMEGLNVDVSDIVDYKNKYGV